MTEFRVQLETSASQLREVWTSLQSTPGTILPPSSYERWVRRASLHRRLSATADLFAAREMAWKAVQAVASRESTRDRNRDIIAYGGLNMNFSVARHLSLTSYVSVAWSIYDRVADGCGRLAAVAELAENPRQNPRMCEDFLGKKDMLGFGAHFHIQQAYAWPLKVIYKLRNWLTHEGYEEGGTPLFKGNRIDDGFILHEDAVIRIQTMCDHRSYDGKKIEACCLHAEEECWPTRDLLRILETYHAEIDTMCAGLLRWSVDSFVGQISAFAERDRAALAATAAKSMT